MDLYIKNLHSGIAYLVLGILFIAILNAIRGMATKKIFGLLGAGTWKLGERKPSWSMGIKSHVNHVSTREGHVSRVWDHAH